MSRMQVNAAQAPVMVCELCTGGHVMQDCQVGNTFGQQEQVNYMTNFPRGQGNSYGNPYPHAYNPNWRNTHPNFSWGNNSNQPQHLQPHQQQPQHQQQQKFEQQPKKSGIEDLLTKYIEGNEKRLESNDMLMKNQSASIKHLEMQMGQIHNLLSNRPQGAFPSDTEKNPREQANAITLRSGKTYDDPKVNDAPAEVNKGKELQAEKDRVQAEKEDEEKAHLEAEKEKERIRVEEGVKRYQDIYDPLPFPGRSKKQAEEKHYKKFLEIFRSLHINIPLADALEQMPKYAKYLKDMLTKKKKWGEHETVMLTEESSALLKKKLPPKLKDPGSFSIPCMIGDVKFSNALCDLGASVNLMPYSLFVKLGIGEMKNTTISLQLADRSIVYPQGIVEDILIKVEHFIYPIDFVVLDMEEDRNVPLILGRAFLRTARTIIDVFEGKILMRLGEEQIEFNFVNSMKYSPEVDSCWMVEEVDMLAVEAERKDFEEDPLKLCLNESIMDEDSADIEDVKEMVRALDDLPVSHETTVKKLKKEEVAEKEEEHPKLELKQLPTHLRYAFLDDNKKYPVIVNASLKPEDEEKLLRTLRKYKRALGWTISDIKGISPAICTHKILMEDEFKPVVQPQRRLNPAMQGVVRKEVVKLLDAGIIYLISDSEWVSPIHCVPKKGGMTVVTNEKNELIPTRTVTGWRVYIDYKRLNDATRKDHFPLPFIDQMLERLAGHEYYCFLDEYSGYNQIAIAPEDQEKTTFTCPYGTFAYRRMPFGLCNAPATFQRCMMAIFSDMVERFIEIFMDDFTITGDSFDQCLKNLTLVLQRCIKTNLVLNREKCHFMVESGIVFGHKISKEGIEVDRAKVEVIEKLPPPTSIRGIRSFLGHAGFYRRFIKDFSQVSKPLCNLLAKDTVFDFSEECLKAFEPLKEKLISAPIVISPDWSIPFELMCDASNYTVGAVLGQRNNKIFHVIYYASH